MPQLKPLKWLQFAAYVVIFLFLKFDCVYTYSSITHVRHSQWCSIALKKSSAGEFYLKCIADIRGGTVSGSAEAHGDGARRIITEKIGSRTQRVIWDPTSQRYSSNLSHEHSLKTSPQHEVGVFLKHIFIPEDVSPDYFSFTRWRVFQRFIAAMINVLGTKALLLALGIESKKVGVAAVTNWVLKDAMGKFVRVLWAGKMGRRFDSDAKRWRYRSSLLYAAGNGLEIVTYVFPSLFLILATVANALKQVSMLTSSATRNTIYRSFAKGENIGDITAKGEAQIACTDVLGLMSGIFLSKILGSSRASIGCAYILLSAIDISSIYKEIRSVVFTTLNYERAYLIVLDYLLNQDKAIGSPFSVSKRENIFFSSTIKPCIFRTLSQSGIVSEQLEELAKIFRGEKYMLTYDKNVGISVILRYGADGSDILRSLLALGKLERSLKSFGLPRSQYISHTEPGFELMKRSKSNITWNNVLESTKRAQRDARKEFGSFLGEIREHGWNVNKFMFGNIDRRTEWEYKL